MAVGQSELDSLKQRLARLGVSLASMSDMSPSVKMHVPQSTQHRQADIENSRSNRREVADLLERVGNVERGLHVADNLANAAAARINAQATQSAIAAAAATLQQPSPAKSPKPTSKTRKVGARGKVNSKATGTIPQTTSLRASAAARCGSAPRADLLKGVPPHTPLSTVLHQYKEAEVAWAHEKAQLRREAEEQRKRANKLDTELRRMGRVAEHRSLDAKSLRSALKNRDTQLETAMDRIKELEVLLARTQEEGAARAAALEAERDDCKALLLATLQRLETVDQIVQRADMSSAMMQDKMKMLEDERLKALEHAARARAEVAELTESRRKLQWQSKLLEKMSEVQLKHNQRKSESIRKLLNREEQADVTTLGDLANHCSLGGRYAEDDDSSSILHGHA